MCERKDVFASAIAVARAFPQYSRKSEASKGDKKERTITTEFILADKSLPLTEEDCLMLENAAKSVRLAARIVDMPCNEMNTDHMINVRLQNAVLLC